MNVWTECQGEQQICALDLQPWRLVEAQHILSTRDLVDTAKEHELLEALLERAKPPIHQQADYLIFTPFRYPSLKYGSRFAQSFECSCWYGSLEFETALSEIAYYRFLFLKDTTADLGYIEVLLTAFQAWLKTLKGIDLTKPPFLAYRDSISDKTSYQTSHALGRSMRAAQVEAFVFYSARSQQNGSNVAAFIPDIFQRHQGQQTFHHQTWQCMANHEFVEFTRSDLRGVKRHVFSAAEFTS